MWEEVVVAEQLATIWSMPMASEQLLGFDVPAVMGRVIA